MSTLEIPTKLDPDCGLIYLIDENLCLSDSFDIIKANTASLSAALFQMETIANNWNVIYTRFREVSAKWIIAAERLTEYNASWLSAYTTINSLSALWTPPFSVSYPEVLPFTVWYGLEGETARSDYFSTTVFESWLNANFDPNRYLAGQPVLVYVSLYYEQPFTLDFYKSFYEDCNPAGGDTIECSPCSRPYRACAAGADQSSYDTYYRAPGGSPNAYDKCGSSQANRPAVRVVCQAWGQKNLEVVYNFSSTDTFVNRILTLRYINTRIGNTLQWKFNGDIT